MIPRAYMRAWAFNGETPTKERNPATGRMGMPFRFKLLGVTKGQCLPDDEPLIAQSDVEALLAFHAKTAPLAHRIVSARTEAETLAACRELAKLYNDDLDAALANPDRSITP